jgi:hypothetical protein
VQISAQQQAILIESFRGFPRYLQASAWRDCVTLNWGSQSSSVSTVSGYGLEGWAIEVRSLA